MIIAEITNNKVLLKGHAEYAEYGKDVICAAVSMLWYAVTEKLEKEEIDFSMKEEDGYSELIVKTANQMTEIVLDVMRCGVELLAENYPNNIFLKKV